MNDEIPNIRSIVMKFFELPVQSIHGFVGFIKKSLITLERTIICTLFETISVSSLILLLTLYNHLVKAVDNDARIEDKRHMEIPIERLNTSKSLFKDGSPFGLWIFPCKINFNPSSLKPPF